MKELLDQTAEETASRIALLAKQDSLIFPIFTDSHIHTLEEDGICALFSAMESLSKVLHPNGVIALGDNLAMLGRERQAGNAEIAALLSGIFDRVSGIWECPLYTVNGNHDGIGTDFFTPSFWYSVTGGRYDCGTAQRAGESAYYYVDFPGVRMVVLSLPSGSDLDAPYPTPHWEYGCRQLQWLAHTALAYDGPVLLVMHVPFYYTYRGDMSAMLGTFNGTRRTQSTIAALSGWIADREIAEAIFRAFRTHTAYDNEACGIHMEASGENAVLSAALSGHMHNDSFHLPCSMPGKLPSDTKSGESDKAHTITNLLPCAQFVTASSNPSINPDLRGKTTFPVTMDIAVLTPSAREITLVRYGDGEDRAWRW